MGCTPKSLRWVGRFEQREQEKNVKTFDRARARIGWAAGNFQDKVSALAPLAKAPASGNAKGQEMSSKR